MFSISSHILRINDVVPLYMEYGMNLYPETTRKTSIVVLCQRVTNFKWHSTQVQAYLTNLSVLAGWTRAVGAACDESVSCVERTQSWVDCSA